jgi:hypothetical protein
MNIDHLKALVSAAKSSEHLYEEQAAAIKFTTTFGDQLIAMAEVGQAMRDKYVEDVQGEYGPYTQEELYIRRPEIKAWDVATKGPT